MKKILVVSTIFLAFASCNNANTNSNNESDTAKAAGINNPASVDTTLSPNGMTNSEVISTDTAAMNMQNSINKSKATKKTN